MTSCSLLGEGLAQAELNIISSVVLLLFNLHIKQLINKYMYVICAPGETITLNK